MFNRHSSTDQRNFQGFGGGNCRGAFRKKMEEAFANGGPQQWGRGWGRYFAGRKAANIAETENAYILSLFAAGLNKENFSLSVAGQVLTVSYKAVPAGDSNYIYQEYEPVSFERSFQLNEKVLTEQISAAYTDGVLQITLPKNPETNQPAQEVKIS